MAKPIHSMIRVLDEARSVAFYQACLGLQVADRIAFPSFTLVYMRDPASPFELELTVNNDRTEPYDTAGGYGHLAVAVDDLEAEHARMVAAGASPGGVGTAGGGAPIGPLAVSAGLTVPGADGAAAVASAGPEASASAASAAASTPASPAL